jgi:hypothetical protein
LRARPASGRPPEEWPRLGKTRQEEFFKAIVKVLEPLIQDVEKQSPDFGRFVTYFGLSAKKMLPMLRARNWQIPLKKPA